MQADNNEKPPVYDFGWWPEVVGLLAVCALVTFLIRLSTGIM